MQHINVASYFFSELKAIVFEQNLEIRSHAEQEYKLYFTATLITIPAAHIMQMQA